MKASLALLDELRPPTGYRTTFALGTTYSLDLVACAAALLALEGRSREEADAPLTPTLRVLRTMGTKVRIFAQQGCIGPSTRMSAGLISLFDEIVRHVPFPLTDRCFHPKVWLVRQECLENGTSDVRWKLVVGSRNLTCDPSWDLGVTLEGTPDRRTNVGGLSEFARHVSELAGETHFVSKAIRDELDAVDWEFPRGVQSVRFGWHRGDDVACSNDEGHPRGLPDEVDRLLVISPFLDRQTVRVIASRWRALEGDQTLLVGGRTDLERIVREDRAVLKNLRPAILDVAEDPLVEAPEGEQASSPAAAEVDEDEPRGLHAKVLAVASGRSATLLLGSLNATRPAWGGANCEAWLVLKGSTENLMTPLWEWAEGHASLLDPGRIPPATAEQKEADELDRVHATVSAASFTLDDTGTESRLLASERLVLPLGFSLSVARSSVPSASVRWVGDRTRLPACGAGERTRFVLMTLRGPKASKAWLQVVKPEPEIDSSRNAAALHALLSPERLPELLLALLDPGGSNADGDDDPPSRNSAGRSASTSGSDAGLRLETLVSLLQRSKEAGILHETVESVGRLVQDYRTRPHDDASRLRELFEAWDAIEEGFQ